MFLDEFLIQVCRKAGICVNLKKKTQIRHKPNLLPRLESDETYGDSVCTEIIHYKSPHPAFLSQRA